jgi:small-conductance mechanosensitive channel
MVMEILKILDSYPLLKSVSPLIVALFAAWLVEYIFKHFLGKLLQKTKTKLDDKLIKILKFPIFWSVFIAGAYIFLLSVSVSDRFLELSQNILTTLLITLWGIAISQISKLLLHAYDQKQTKSRRLSDAIPFLENLIMLGVLGLALLIALDTWGINITPLLASAGVVGIAVAFAAKDTVSNLFGGVSVFFDRPYKVGDYVIIQDKYRGEVIEIGMRSTKIKTRDNVLLTVPNSVMVTNAVINETGFDPKLRIRIPLGVAYNSDLDKVEYALMNLMKEHKEVLEDPTPRIRYRNFSESSIDLEAMCVIAKPADRGRIMHELIKEIDKVFREEKIEMPFPQREVHINNK